MSKGLFLANMPKRLRFQDVLSSSKKHKETGDVDVTVAKETYCMSMTHHVYFPFSWQIHLGSGTLIYCLEWSGQM